MNKTATLLFNIISKCFERKDISEFHPIIGGYRTVVKHEGLNYQITCREIIEPQDDIDLDSFVKSTNSTFSESTVSLKKDK